ncbi:MAG: zinc ABC transporter substrate-binding protein [Candidatus Thiodiazotropha sp. (ex Monitilora ramsayi)]|nr:zinc ABC transporter substrate-binding protein [Candidatus Thiodiazotropha sp. (ex Monitilora ramsayi)]
MQLKNRILLSTLLLGIFLSQSVFAGPRVVVSLPAIHSLVTNIMQGVGEPVLLYDHDSSASTTLDPFQKSELLTADLVIWIGSGLETSLSDTLNSMPPIKDHTMALSKTVPLLLKKEFDGIAASRQNSRDLKFWHDPKIAIMAVRQITPTLVRLDPDNTERYLDNEIQLLKRIKQMSREIAASISTQGSIPESVLNQFEQYFTNRFIPAAMITPLHEGGTIKVSSEAVSSCAQRPDEPATLGTGFYFETMERQAKRVQACAAQFNRSKVAKTVKQKNRSS